MKRSTFIGLIGGAVLAGCVSAGVEVRPEQVSHFKPGITTLPEVIAVLGPASVASALEDGSTLLVYTYVTSRPHPENFLPFIGALVGGADTHTSAAVFVFDPRGTLKSAHTTTSTVGTGFGGGASAAQPAAAPAMPVAPAASAGAPVVVERVQTPTVQTIEPLPEQPAQPALDDGLEAPEDSVQPQAPEQ